MPSLYNCKHSGDQYKITKFDSDFNVEASYLCTLDACECPAGHRPTCRHRQMLPKFINRNYVGTEYFFDFDRGGWVQGWKEEPAEAPATNKELDVALDTIMQPEFGASAALLSEPSKEPSQSTAEQKANMEFLKAGGTISTHYMIDGSINTFKTIDHESLAPKGLDQASEARPTCKVCGLEDGACICAHILPSPSPTIRRRV